MEQLRANCGVVELCEEYADAEQVEEEARVTSTGRTTRPCPPSLSLGRALLKEKRTVRESQSCDTRVHPSEASTVASDIAFA